METSDMHHIHKVGRQITQLQTMENPPHPEPLAFLELEFLRGEGSYICELTAHQTLNNLRAPET